jgi:hypothetical protein
MNRSIAQFECEGINRRQLLQRASALLVYSAAASSMGATPEGDGRLAAPKPAEVAWNRDVEYGQETLPI